MLNKIVPGLQPKKLNKFIPDKKMLDDNVGFVEILEVFGSDLTIANAARVSFNKESEFEPVKIGYGDGAKIIGYKLSTRDEKLIQYLAENDHVTPFFHPQIRFRIKMPIFVIREWYRHTIGFARNEVSRRYVTYEPEFFVPRELRKKDENVKQGSSSEVVDNSDEQIKLMNDYCKKALEYYNSLLEDGVCPEQARMILPQSMYTEFIETASLAGYARLVNLRLDSSAQLEIRKYANIVSCMLTKFFPVSWRTLIKSDYLERKVS
ncbi:MAG: hypothetical protein US49_C0005G0062 [candidate division TM6 bacterium GW2011_GWF2_37_49]|nr:MAG: hypothetical protein US49_C0005G0062 [candidate division TM6 bacterium GW2011_GWF2_37_49]